MLEEVSGIVGRKELLEMYHLATREPYSFLYINLVSPTVNAMLYINFNQKLHIDKYNSLKSIILTYAITETMKCWISWSSSVSITYYIKAINCGN